MPIKYFQKNILLTSRVFVILNISYISKHKTLGYILVNYSLLRGEWSMKLKQECLMEYKYPI